MVLRQHLQLGGNLGNFLISFMVLIEVPIHKYFSEPQNYNPVDESRLAWKYGLALIASSEPLRNSLSALNDKIASQFGCRCP